VPRSPSPAFRSLLLYAQDSRGLGHINRALTIARRVLAAHPNLVTYIATKSPVAHFTIPERCDYIKLPTRLTPPMVRQTAREEEAGRERFRAIRSRMLCDAALGLAPDVVVVDHEPLGAAGEFRDGLRALKAERPDTKFVFGLRDIMDDADRIRAQWRAMGVYDAFEGLYDGIAVYGSPALYDVAEAYAIPASVRPKLHYCGYVVRDPPAADGDGLRRELGLPPNGPLVLTTVGSGSDGYPVLNAALAAVERLHATFPDLSAVFVTGPFMPPQQQARLCRRATATCRIVPHADTFRLMAAADAIVSMGGYNSVCEALVAARPLVIVPRATHKIEQRLRAEALAARGLARWVHPRDLRAGGLVDALEWALRSDRAAHARRVSEVIPAFDGARQLATYLSQWLGDG
jgi:predicted glycosyltransferase